MTRHNTARHDPIAFQVLGVIVMFHFCVKILGYPAPLGVRAEDVHMIGLMAALGLTVALFVSEVAFEDPKLKGTKY